MRFKGSIIALKASVNASGDIPRRVTLELFGEDFAALHSLLNKPLDIEITEEQNGGPFDDR